ncbi:MAG: FkbM family methyltransferase [Verrucomicrobiota bacterium]
MITRIKRLLSAPEYWYQPRQLIRRAGGRALGEVVEVRLIWGLPMEVELDRMIGVDVFNRGVFERSIPEMISRLLDEGEVAVDVGAHVGQNASAMAIAAGGGGRVIAVEAHPEIFEFLNRNVARWERYEGLARVEAISCALSAEAGTGYLREFDGFELNSGTSTLEGGGIGEKVSHEVKVGTLDELLAGEERGIGVLKLDVEGHEGAVLAGASGLLARDRIRDILYEQLGDDVGGVHERLREAGYELFSIFPGVMRVALGSWDERRGGSRAINYLATRDGDRVRTRLAKAGWQCLRRGMGRRVRAKR